MATRRQGKPYIWTSNLAKILGGQRCVWALWFKSRYKYDKFEEQGGDLAKWNRDHDALMKRRRRQLEADGWTVTVEEANEFKLEGAVAVLAGKPDLIAIKGDRVLLVDGKTGREREADVWQVLIYLYALPKKRPELAALQIEGEVHYRAGDITVTPDELTDGGRLGPIVDLIKVVGSDTPPAKHPSREDCRFCNIGPKDCPQRVCALQTTTVGDF